MDYSIDDLKSSDRQAVNTVDRFTNSVLSDECIESYLDNNISGKTTRAIYSDVLKPFVEFLREQAEYLKVDMIIEFMEMEEESAEKENVFQ